MKRIAKLIAIPSPLAEALRILAYEKRKTQTLLMVEALVSLLESEDDPRIADLVTQYHGENAYQHATEASEVTDE